MRERDARIGDGTRKVLQNFAGLSIAPPREAPYSGLIFGKTVPGNSQTKMDHRPRQTDDVLVIYYSSRIAHVLRDSASSGGLFQVATEFETN